MNIHDVAQRAKVSTATVSRVISGIDVVRPQTRERVMNAIKELGFVPNLSARSLSMGRSRMLGIIISDITNPFFPDLVQHFTQLAEAAGYVVLVSHTNYDVARAGQAIERMLARKVEGVAILTSELHESLVQQLNDHSVPIVFLDTSASYEFENWRTIAVDYDAGIHQAFDHLLGLGHKRVAFISGPTELRSAEWRKASFVKLMEERGIKISPSTLAQGDHRVEGGYAAMQALLAAKTPPTAVLTSNDLTAIGAINAIYDAGLRVPEDISVVGYDDIEISASYNPRLTTVRLSRTEIAVRAFEALHAATKGEKMPSPEKPIVTELVVRKSTARPKK